MSSLPPDDQLVPGVEQWWRFEAWSPADQLAVYVEFGWSPSDASGWYVALLTAPEGPVALVVDPDIAMQKPTSYLEFRAEGIWAQHVCETPFEHWTVGLEAFGVTLDAPADAAGQQWGRRTAVGLDVEWESEAAAAGDAEDSFSRHSSSFDQRCRVSGEVLLDDRAIDFDGVGRRGRGWVEHEARHVEAPEPGHGSLVVPVRVDRPKGSVIVTLALDDELMWTRSETPT